MKKIFNKNKARPIHRYLSLNQVMIWNQMIQCQKRINKLITKFDKTIRNLLNLDFDELRENI